MRFNLPRSEQPLMKVTARAGEWSSKKYLSRLSRECEIAIPQTISPDEVEVTAEACDDSGKPVEPAVLLKAAKPKAVPVGPAPAEDPNPKRVRPKAERRKTKRRVEETAQEERPSDEPLSAEYVVNDDRETG